MSKRRDSIVSVLVFAAVVLAASLLPRLGSADEADPKEIAKQLQEFIAAKNASALANLVTRLAKLDDPKTVGFLVDAAVALPSLRNYQAASRAIGSFSGKETLDELGRLLGGKATDFRQRILVADGFGLRSDATSREAIHAAIEKDKKVNVRVAALRACVKRKEKEAVPVIIAHVGRHQRERDRDWIEGRQALLELTGQDFDSVEDWKKFWDGNKDSLDPRKLDRKDGPTRVTVKKAEDSVEFFGSEILSQNVIFVIDCSGSMILYDEDPEYTGLTHTDEGLEKAFEDPAADTIVLLSDGAPFKQANQNALDLQKKILERVRDLNASRKLRIDTYGFEGEGKAPKSVGGGSAGGGGADSEMVKFLKKLAAENGGDYKPIK